MSVEESIARGLYTKAIGELVINCLETQNGQEIAAGSANNLCRRTQERHPDRAALRALFFQPHHVHAAAHVDGHGVFRALGVPPLEELYQQGVVPEGVLRQLLSAAVPPAGGRVGIWHVGQSGQIVHAGL